MQTLITPQEVLQIAFAWEDPSQSGAESIIRESKIIVAQEYFLRPRLGDELYTQIENGEHNSLVENYLKEPLAYYIRCGVLDEFSVEVDTNGVIQKIGSQSTRTNTRESLKTQTSKTITTNAFTEVKNSNQDSTTDDTLNSTYESRYEQDKVEDKTNESTSPSPLAFENSESSSLTSTTAATSDIVIESQTKQDIDKKVYTDLQKEQTLNDSQHSSDDTTEDDLLENDNQNLESKEYTPASVTQVQSLKMRSLSDANILMRRALRYIRMNAKEFPAFDPSIGFFI